MNTFDVLNQIKGQPDGTTITFANQFINIICSTMILQGKWLKLLTLLVSVALTDAVKATENKTFK